MTTTSHAPDTGTRLTITAAGHLDTAPEATIISPLLIGSWTKLGVAVRICTPTCRDNNWEPCTGHHDSLFKPGDRVIIGRPGHPTHPRAVYIVAATGTAGFRLTREA